MSDIQSKVDLERDQVLERVKIANDKRGSSRWRIKPRYGCGSPADLAAGTVVKAAVTEVRCYHDAVEGTYGEEKQEEATRVGLAGIALVYWERGCHWEVLDLLTGDTYDQPYSGRKRCKHTRVTAARLKTVTGMLMRVNEGAKFRELVQAQESLLGQTPHFGTRIGEPTFLFGTERLF